MKLTEWNNEAKEFYVYPEAWALYDGGWRAEDWELFKETENADEEDREEFERAMSICEEVVKTKE